MSSTAAAILSGYARREREDRALGVVVCDDSRAYHPERQNAIQRASIREALSVARQIADGTHWRCRREGAAALYRSQVIDYLVNVRIPRDAAVKLLADVVGADAVEGL